MEEYCHFVAMVKVQLNLTCFSMISTYHDQYAQNGIDTKLHMTVSNFCI